MPFSAGIPPGHPEAAMINRVASTIDKEFVKKSDERSRYRRMNSISGNNMLFEFACSDDSIIGREAQALGVACVRLSRSTVNLCNQAHVEQAISQLEAKPGADAWASITHAHGKPYKGKMTQKQQETRTLLSYATQFLERALELGGRVAFELPASDSLWQSPELLQFEKRQGLKRVYFHCCSLNLRGRKAKLIKKSLCVSTSDLRLIQFLSQHQCTGDHEHEEAIESNTYHTLELAHLLMEAWYPSKWYSNVPSLRSTSALVTLNLSRSVWLRDEKGLQAVRQEALGLRQNGAWLDSTVTTVAELKRWARKSRKQDSRSFDFVRDKTP